MHLLFRGVGRLLYIVIYQILGHKWPVSLFTVAVMLVLPLVLGFRRHTYVAKPFRREWKVRSGKVERHVVPTPSYVVSDERADHEANNQLEHEPWPPGLDRTYGP